LLRRALVSVALIVVVGLATPLLLPALGRFLVTEDPAEHADAIVVLAGSYPDRVLEGVELYRQGLAPRIILCREPETAGFRRVNEPASRFTPSDINRMVAGLGAAERHRGARQRRRQHLLGSARGARRRIRRGYHSILVGDLGTTRRAAEIYRLLAGDR
jgi:uncharacterized SAM-binding protein YcdF (DUF218 family)